MLEQVADNIAASRRRREAGQLACAECRRLQIRCDRKIPCAACSRRGHASICPTGVLPSAARRIILATQVELDQKIQRMNARVRDLEIALQKAQSSICDDIHPLLSSTHQWHVEKTLESKKPPFVPVGAKNALSAEVSSVGYKTDPEGFTSTDGLSHAFGTLAITTDRGSKWYGKTAEPEHFLEKEEQPQATTFDSGLPPEILYLSTCFPFVAFHGLVNSVSDQLEHWLPPRATAWKLVENYFGRFAAMYNIIPRDRFFKQTWQPLYEFCGHITLDQLALMFIVLACGSFVDSTSEAQNPEADKFYQLARCTMTIKASENWPSVTDVQIEARKPPLLDPIKRLPQIILAFYLQLSSRTGREEAWISVGVAAKMCQYIGLHRDPASIRNLSNEEIELRRRIFCESFDFDLWLAVGFGRPQIHVDAYIDCQVPSHKEAEYFNDRKWSYGSHHCYRDIFCRKYAMALTEEIVSPNASAAYQSVLVLDKNIRDDVLPSHLPTGIGPTHGFGPSEEGLALQHSIALLTRYFVLLMIHRSYSCQATFEMPLSPLKHRFGPSVLATYKCAISIADAMDDLESHPIWARRLVPLYSIAFGAAATLGSFVIFAPRWIHAAKFLMYLDRVYRIFENVETSQVRNLLPALLKLRDKAREAYTCPRVPNEQAFGLELALRLSGDKSLLDGKKKSPNSLANSPSFREAHPTIVGWLDEFGQPSGVVTPVRVDAGCLGAANEESWQAYSARIGLPM